MNPKSIFDIFNNCSWYYQVKLISTSLHIRHNYISKTILVNRLKIKFSFEYLSINIHLHQIFYLFLPYIIYNRNVNDVFTTHQFWWYLQLMSFLVLEKIAGNKIVCFLVLGKTPGAESCLCDQMKRIVSF